MSIMNSGLSRIVLPFRKSIFIYIIHVYTCKQCIENASDIIKCTFNFQTDFNMDKFSFVGKHI